MKRTTAVVAILVLLSGCTGGDESPIIETPTSTQPSAGLVEPPVEDDLAACAIVAETLVPVLEIVTAMVDDPTGTSVDTVEVSEKADLLREMLSLSTPTMDAYAAPYASVVLLLDDVFKGKADGTRTVDTGAYRDGSIKVMAYCVDEVGYRP